MGIFVNCNRLTVFSSDVSMLLKGWTSLFSMILALVPVQSCVSPVGLAQWLLQAKNWLMAVGHCIDASE